MFAPTKGKTHLLDSTDFWNLSGRAGRLRREFQGNIFLIDYEHWEKKPLSGPKDAHITPAIEETVRRHQAELVDIISDGSLASRQDKPDLETTFARLYSDMKRGDLGATLKRIGLESTSSEAVDLANALQIAAGKVSIPAEILNRSPNISAHKQQRLFDYLHGVVSRGKDAARAVIPLHPRDSNAWNSYVEILRVCHDLILGLDTSRGLHRFHVTIALKWMLGLPLPQIIDEQITRAKPKSPQTVIRETLDLIEKEIRFQAVRLFGCYNALLLHALSVSGMMDLATGVPSLPLYLEIGASDKTMISFVSLGLSRVTAMKLNELSARKDLDVPAALRWLRTRPYQSLGLSQLLLDEINAVIAN